MPQNVSYKGMEMSQSRKKLAESEDQLKIIEEIFDMDSVFKDETIFSLDHVPSYLPHRIEILKSLTLLLKGSTGHNGGKFHQNVIMMGPTGSGKTAIAKHFGSLLEEFSRKKDTEYTFIYKHVNVRKLKTPYVILTGIIKSLIPYFPRRGYSTPELLNILYETVKTKRMHMLICLDEIDGLEGSDDEKSSFLYSLTKQDSHQDNDQVISLLLLSRDERFLDTFDDSTRRSLLKNTVFLSPYTVRELENILTQRVEQGFVDNIIEPGTVNMIARIAESSGGSARYGIELLWKAAKHADKHQRKRISYDDVRTVISSVASAYISHETLEVMDFNQKLLLLAITTVFSGNMITTSVPLSKIKDMYREICSDFQVKPREKTQVWKYLRNFKKLNLLDVYMVNEGVKGRQSYIELLEIPAEILREELLALITGEIFSSA